MRDKRTTAREFHDAKGVDDWRVLYWGAYAYYRIGSFAQGARFVAAIADVAEETGHYPDVDLRPEGVTVRTFSRQDGALSESDIALARRISDMAGELGLEPDPSQVQMVGIAVAQDAAADVRPFLVRRPRVRVSGRRRCDRPTPAQSTSLVPCAQAIQTRPWSVSHRRRGTGRSG